MLQGSVTGGARQLARMGCILALAWLLAACGPRPTPAPTPPPPFTLAAPSATPRPPDAPLTVLGHFRGEAEVPLRALLARFETTHGIPVRYQGAEAIPEALQAMLAAGQTPDVIFLPVPDWLQEMAAGGALAPLSPDAASAVRSNFGEGWQALVRWDENLYGVPLDANAKSLIWYQPQTLADEAADLPRSLAALQQLAETLAARGQPAFAVPGGAGWPLTDWLEHVLLAELGPEGYDALLARRLPWTDPTVERAVRRFTSLLQDAHVMDGVEGATTLPLARESFYQAFDNEAPNAAMWLGQGSIVNAYVATSSLRPGIEYDWFPFPLEGALIGSGSVAVATTDAPAAMTFLAFLASPDTLLPWVRSGGLVSPNQVIPLDAYPNPLVRREAELIVNASGFRYDLSDRLPPNLRDALPDLLREMLRNPDAVPALLATLEQIATREQGAPRER